MGNKRIDFISKIKQIKGIEYIVICIVALLSLFVLFGDKLASCKTNNSSAFDGYASSVEQSLEKTLSKIHGAGKVSVAVSLSGGNRTVIAKDVTTVKNGNEVQITETALVLGGKVVVLCELYPEVTGVLVVASGADDISVRLNILSSVTTLLGIEEERVEIIKGK